MTCAEVLTSFAIYIFWKSFDELSFFYEFMWTLSYWVFFEYIWIALQGKKILNFSPAKDLKKVG